MAETLLIRMAPDATGFRDWLLADDQGQAKSPVQVGAPDEGVIRATSRIVVLVPGAEVLLSEARVPGRNRKRALRAIPYALEERLAADVDNLHFALGPAQDDERFPVAVVDRSRMDAWAALLEDRGIEANQWLPDVLALPAPESGAWSLMIDAGTVLVRGGAYTGFASEPGALETLVSLFAAREELPERATVFGPAVVWTSRISRRRWTRRSWERWKSWRAAGRRVPASTCCRAPTAAARNGAACCARGKPAPRCCWPRYLSAV